MERGQLSPQSGQLDVRRLCDSIRRGMSEQFVFRPMRGEEASAVSELVFSLFSEFVGSDYSEEGILEFRKFVSPEALELRGSENHSMWVAETGGILIGMIEIRDGNHVALLFVDKSYHRHGVAKDLLRAALKESRATAPDLERVTVNSSRYGIPAFEKLGFRQTGPERDVNGIAFIPMAMRLEN